MTKEEMQAELAMMIREHREQQKQKKPMYLQHMQSKQVHKNLFYALAFTCIFAVVPSLYLGITVGKVIGTFAISFFATMHFYDGFIDKRTVLAWTDD